MPLGKQSAAAASHEIDSRPPLSSNAIHALTHSGAKMESKKMRKHRLTLFLLLISLCLSGTACASTQGVDSFRLGGEGRTAQYYPVFVLPNGNLIISVYTQGGIGGEPLSATGHYQTCLLCVNPQNEILWSRYFEGTTLPDDTVVYSVCQIGLSENDGLAILLQQHTQQDGAYFLPVTLDAGTGEIRETGEKTPYAISDDQADRYISTYSMASLYVQVITDNFSGVNGVSVVRAYDYANRSLWEQPMEALGMSNIIDCLETSTGVLLIGVNHSVDEDGCFSSDTTVTMVTETGASLWNYAFTQKSNSNISGFLNREGQLIWLGSLTERPNTADEENWQYLAFMDTATGALLWDQTTPFTSEAPLPCGTVLALDSGYLLTGRSQGNTLFETVDIQGKETQKWSVSDETGPQDWMLVQAFFRQGELWTARFGITPRQTFMQYDKVSRNAADGSNEGGGVQ